MDCGIPYLSHRMPGGTIIIPDWNDLVYRPGDWRGSLREVLHSTNNFPEFTGRICPAPCEEACTLNISDEPVTIKTIECAIVDKAWRTAGLFRSRRRQRPARRSPSSGSGPAGLACAQQLARAGHEVHVREACQGIGGLLRYGIPDFKMEKHHIDRRVSRSWRTRA